MKERREEKKERGGRKEKAFQTAKRQTWRQDRGAKSKSANLAKFY